MTLNKIVTCIFIGLISLINCKAQDYSQKIRGNWLISNTTDFYNNNIESDLPFYGMIFNEDSIMEMDVTFALNGQRRFYKNYRIEGNKLNIFWASTNMDFEIQKCSIDSLILLSNHKKYFFTKYLTINTTKKGAEIISSEDTVKFSFVTRSKFKTDFHKYINRNIYIFQNETTSYNVDISFMLRKNKIIDSLFIKADTTIKNELTNLIIETSKKWIPAKMEGKNIDKEINFMIFIASKEFNEIRSKSIDETCLKLFDKGYELYTSGNVDSALYYYSETITYTEFIKSINKYSFPRVYVDNIWMNSILNKAIILYDKGEKGKACNELQKINGLDTDAYNLYKTNCLNK